VPTIGSGHFDTRQPGHCITLNALCLVYASVPAFVAGFVLPHLPKEVEG
jgi:hypothetical protein